MLLGTLLPLLHTWGPHPGEKRLSGYIRTPPLPLDEQVGSPCPPRVAENNNLLNMHYLWASSLSFTSLVLVFSGITSLIIYLFKSLSWVCFG